MSASPQRPDWVAVAANLHCAKGVVKGQTVCTLWWHRSDFHKWWYIRKLLPEVINAHNDVNLFKCLSQVFPNSGSDTGNAWPSSKTRISKNENLEAGSRLEIWWENWNRGHEGVVWKRASRLGLRIRTSVYLAATILIAFIIRTRCILVTWHIIDDGPSWKHVSCCLPSRSCKYLSTFSRRSELESCRHQRSSTNASFLTSCLLGRRTCPQKVFRREGSVCSTLVRSPCSQIRGLSPVW